MNRQAQHPLHSLLWPESVAVIGASADQAKISGRLLAFLVNNGFAGQILPINPSRKEILDLPCFPDIEAAAASIDGRVDVALIAIPASAVLPELARCARLGVRNAVVITSGFAEEGGESAGIQERMGGLARESGMRISGPNGQGFYNAALNLAATFTPTLASPPVATPRISEQRVAIVAQSGAFGFALYQHGWRAGLNFSYVVATGNEADIDLSEFVEYIVEDDSTKVIFLYVETIRDPERFERAALRALERDKHIIAIKIGQSDSGQRATASHTASMAGWKVAYTAFFERCGVSQALDIDEALIMASLLVSGPTPQGNRLGIISSSGGVGAWAADTFERLGGSVPLLSGEIQESIQALIPAYGGLSNPIDVTAAGARTGAMLKIVDLLQSSDEVDAVLVLTTLTIKQFVFDRDELARLAKTGRKPLLFYTVTVPTDFALDSLAEAGVTTTTNLPATCSALLRLATPFAQGFIQRTPPPPVPDPVRQQIAAADTVLCEYEAKSILPYYGIEISPECLVTTEGEALGAAEELGYPLAMKLQSPALPHKSDIGGVALNIADSGQLRSAHRALMGAAAAHCDPADLRGVLVQRMAPRGHELIIGAVRDPSVGPLISVGFGGIAVELYRDVVYRIAPVSVEGAGEMVDQLTSSALLKGFRGQPAIDLTPLLQLIADTSRIAWELSDAIDELEFNPVIVHADGSGLTIADALMRKRHLA